METNLVSKNNRTIDHIETFPQKTGKNKSKEKLKSSKSYGILPCLKKANNKLYSKRGSNLLINQQYNDPDNLKQTLNTCKARMFEQNKNFLSLKIRYGKLYNENLGNKNLISNILGVPLDKYLTKEEVLDKIENAKINKYNREILKEAVNTIILRTIIEEKREKKINKKKYLRELEENSKTKKISELMKDYVSNCEEQRSLLRILKTLAENNSTFENDIKKINESLEKESTTKKETIKTKEEKMFLYEKLNLERNELVKENKNLDEKIKRNMMLNKEKDDKNTKYKLSMGDLKDEMDNLELYKKDRNDKIKRLEEKKNLVEELKNARKEQENNIMKLKQEKDKLDDKMSEYNVEKSKLIKKAKEPKSDIDKMKKLEKDLIELKNTIKNLKELHEEKKITLNKIKEREKEKSQKNEEIRRKNNLEKDQLNHKIQELQIKIKYLEEQKASQNDKSIIKTKNEKLRQDNESIKKENDKYQQEIKEFDEKLKEYKTVEKDLKRAQEELDSYEEVEVISFNTGIIYLPYQDIFSLLIFLINIKIK